MPYAIMDKGSPWITPSLLCKKWPDPSSSRTTRVDQWQFQLKVNCGAAGTLELDGPHNFRPIILIE